MHGALELAGGLANPSRITADQGGQEVDVVEAQPATAYIFSDGRFDAVKNFSLGNLKPVYVPIGSFDAANLAITTLATRRNESRPEEQQAFVQVANFTDKPQKATVELSLDGQFLDAREVEIPAGESAGAVFPLENRPAGGLTARLKYQLDYQSGGGGSHDALAQDDVAYAALGDAAHGKVLVVTPGDVALEVAIQTEEAKRLADVRIAPPSILESAEYQRDAEDGAYNLVIYDQCAPKKCRGPVRCSLGDCRRGRRGTAVVAKTQAVSKRITRKAAIQTQHNRSAHRKSSTGIARIRCSLTWSSVM